MSKYKIKNKYQFFDKKKAKNIDIHLNFDMVSTRF